MPLLRLLVLAPLMIWLAAAHAVAQDHLDQRSPFDDLRWDGARPQVQIGGEWYAPLSIDGVSTPAVLSFCESQWPRQAGKRFAEDLVEALVLMGHAPGATVEIEALRLSDGTSVSLAAVPMTSARRSALMGKGDARPTAAPTFAAAEALADIERFGSGLRERFAYLGLGAVDLERELEVLRERFGAADSEWQIEELADAFERLLLRFGDGHAAVRVPDASAEPDALHLPVLLELAAGGVVALHPNRMGLIDKEHPYVVSLDGEPLSTWTDSRTPLTAAGSPQLVERRTRRLLREWTRARAERDLPPAKTVTLGLSSDRAVVSAERELELRLSGARPVYGDWPQAESRRLTGDIGYLRLPGMDDELVPELHERMAEFRDTAGLVIDVRGNGGGSRGLLVALAGYLRQPDGQPWIANVAAFRTPAFPADHLDARFMHAAGDPRLTPAQAAAIEAFAPQFRPELELGPGFSAWHYLVLGPTGDAREYAFEPPVVVLSDAGCFSATDIFLGALAELPQVTLVGTPSSGGSARSQSFNLPNSGIEVRCASMASFRPDGRLYDGRGIEVDVEVHPGSTYFSLGGPDAALQLAHEQLR